MCGLRVFSVLQRHRTRPRGQWQEPMDPLPPVVSQIPAADFPSTRSSVWAKAYYDRQGEEGRFHPAAVRALAYKWIRSIFRCWKEGKLYDEHISICNLCKNEDRPWVPSPPWVEVRSRFSKAF
jgi:hypothetical protein